MIFDRTASDAEKAIKIREEKVKKGENLTDNEIEILSRGFVGVDTLNRICEKQAELRRLFNDMGYYNTNIVEKQWSEQDLFLKRDMEIISKNNDILKQAYFVFSTTPANGRPIAHYEEFNKIEKILYDLSEMVDDMKSYFKECGDLECGG